MVDLRASLDRAVNDGINAIGPKIRADLTAISTSAMADGDMAAAALAGQTQESLMLARLAAVRFLSNH